MRLPAASDAHSWCLQSLEKLTGYTTSKDIVNYIMSIENEDDLKDFLNGILQPLNAEKTTFINELIKKIDFSNRSSQYANNTSVETYRIYAKENAEEPIATKSKGKKNRNNCWSLF